MQFEAGGQPPKGTDSPFPKVDFPDSVTSDPATNTWFAYGYRERDLAWLAAIWKSRAKPAVSTPIDATVLSGAFLAGVVLDCFCVDPHGTACASTVYIGDAFRSVALR
jgi:hypothetical protein